MASVLDILLPIFGLILTGYICRRHDILGPTAASELNRFVARLALPALLFRFTAGAHWSELYQPAFIATFALSSLGAFALVLWWRLRARNALADASIDAIAACYANTAYIGLPLCLMVFGQSSMAGVTIASMWVVCVLFALAIALIEAGLQPQGLGQGQRQAPRLFGKVALALLRNPLIAAPAAGMACAAAGWRIPAGADAYLNLLGTAAAPCALVSIGLFLAGQAQASTAALRVALPLTLAKLVLMPALAWLLATRVFMLPTALAQMALVLAALPTGTGPFMLAELYRREGRAASQAILLSTLGSLLSLSAILVYIRA